MSSPVIAIADAVTAELNVARLLLGEQFTAVRGYAEAYSIEELHTLRVTVVPQQRSDSDATRGRDRVEARVQVWIQEHVGAEQDRNRCDALLNLADKIIQLFHQKRLVGVPDAICTQAEQKPLFVPSHLQTKGVMTTILTLFYTYTRAR